VAEELGDKLVRLEMDLGRVADTLGRLEGKDPKPIGGMKDNVTGWIGTIATVLAVIGAFAMTVISPLQEDLNYLKEIREIERAKDTDSVFELGRQTAEIMKIQSEIMTLQSQIADGTIGIGALQIALEKVSADAAAVAERVSSNELRWNDILESRVRESQLMSESLNYRLLEVERHLGEVREQIGQHVQVYHPREPHNE